MESLLQLGELLLVPSKLLLQLLRNVLREEPRDLLPHRFVDVLEDAGFDLEAHQGTERRAKGRDVAH